MLRLTAEYQKKSPKTVRCQKKCFAYGELSSKGGCPYALDIPILILGLPPTSAPWLYFIITITPLLISHFKARCDETEQNCSVSVLRRVADLFTPKDATDQKYSVPSRRRLFTPSDATEQFRSVPSPAVAGRCFGVIEAAILGNWHTADLVSFSFQSSGSEHFRISSIHLLTIPSRFFGVNKLTTSEN